MKFIVNAQLPVRLTQRQPRNKFRAESAHSVETDARVNFQPVLTGCALLARSR